MPPETNRRRIVQRLEAEGWVNRGGGEHDIYEHPVLATVKIAVPRHRTLSPGVVRQIAKLAGWS
jgi:predicted RNA binding protein YcfA (HicA-like mRNA interferase family)